MKIQYKDFDDVTRFDMEAADGDTNEMVARWNGDYVEFANYDRLNDAYKALVKKLEAVEEALNG